MLPWEGHTLYRVRLTEADREELQRRTRTANLKPRTRDRLEMLRMADAGWRIPQIAAHFRIGARRVRVWIKRYLEEGFDALPDQPRSGRIGRLTPPVLESLRTELAKGERTWTLGQLVVWLEEQHAVRLSTKQLGVLLRRAKLSCRRTERDLGHKQDPVQVAVAVADLETLEKGGISGAWTSAM